MRIGIHAMAVTMALVMGASGLAAQDAFAEEDAVAAQVEVDLSDDLAQDELLDFDELPEHPPEEPTTYSGGVTDFAPTAPAAPAVGMFGRDMQPQGPVLRSPVVVELFTSQGCVNCPPADATLGDVVGRSDVLALSWHVDYWDYLGWRDEFARPEFSARQRDYAIAFSQRALYTPQMIVGGRHVVQHIRPAELGALISSERAEPARVTLADRVEGARHQIEITPRSALPAENVVQLIRYLPQRRVDVRGGENSGRQLHFTNVVASVETLARWDGRGPLRLNVTLGAGAELAGVPPDSRHAILVQSLQRGRPAGVVAAIKLD